MFQKYRASGSLWLLLVLFNSGFIQAAVYIVRPMITYRSVELGADSALVGAVGAGWPRVERAHEQGLGGIRHVPRRCVHPGAQQEHGC